MLVTTILGLLEAGLNLWAAKEKNWEPKQRQKYIDEKDAIKLAWWQEWSKPEGERSDAVLDNLKFRLQMVSDSFTLFIQGAPKNA